MRELKVQQDPAMPVYARDLDLRPATIDIIYAEDEEVFRESAIHELLKVGFQRENIHEADNGHGALQHLVTLQNAGHLTNPLLVLLDVRMPGMDGRECALQIQEMVKKKVLRREPFVVCISSISRQVTIDEGKGNFQVVLPKPINKDYLKEALNALENWWTLGHGRQLAAWKTFHPEQLEIIVADTEPACRMSLTEDFVRVGVLRDAISEAEEEDLLLEELVSAQDGDASRPLVVLLGIERWAQSIRTFVDEAKVGQCPRRREPFVVCTSVDSDRIGGKSAVEHFDAFLPTRRSKADVKWCLEFCRLWWLTRGDGPELDGDEDSVPDSESVASVASVGSLDG